MASMPTLPAGSFGVTINGPLPKGTRPDVSHKYDAFNRIMSADASNSLAALPPDSAYASNGIVGGPAVSPEDEMLGGIEETLG